MEHHHIGRLRGSWLRKVTALGFWGFVVVGFGLHGCSNRMGPVYATQRAGGLDSPNLADIFIEHSKVCMETYGRQLEPGRTVLESTVEVNDDGDKLAVAIAGIPETAPDFGACMRNALRDMPIAAEPFRESVEMLKFHLAHAKDSDEALRHFIEAIPGVPIVESELVLEVDEYTVALRVNTKVVAKTEKLIDSDKRTLATIGQMALASLGYDEVIKRAETAGWIKAVRNEQARSAAQKVLIADGTTAVSGSQLLKKFTEYAIKAGIASQVDSPAPGPGDAVAVGILVVGLIHLGYLAAQEILDERERCRQVNEACQQKCLPQLKNSDFGNQFHRCMRQCREAAGCWKAT